MSVKDWKFHDFDMLFDFAVKLDDGKFHRFPVVYKLTHLRPGSLCLLCGDGNDKKRWLRKTKNEGKNGSTRYLTYDTLNDAIDASINWARRKDEEHAAEIRQSA